MPDKIDQLYEDLQARGFAKGKSRNDFRSYMLAPGQQGYQNRKAFFDDMSDRGLTRFKNYEEFSASFLRPSNKTQPAQQKPTPTNPTGGNKVLRSAADAMRAGINAANAKINEIQSDTTPLTPERRAEMMRSASNIVNGSNETVQAFDERQKNRQEYQRQSIQQGTLGTAPVKTKRVNQDTGKVEDAYLTSSGSEYGSEYEAGKEQRQINDAAYREAHPLEASLRDVNRDIEDIQEQEALHQEEMRKKHDEAFSNLSGWERFKNAIKGALLNTSSTPSATWNANAWNPNLGEVAKTWGLPVEGEDTEGRVLSARRSLAEETKRFLLDVQKDTENNISFWNGRGPARAGDKIIDALTSVDTWDFGAESLKTQLAIADAAIKDGEGEDLSYNERKLLDAVAMNAAMNGRFGDQLSGWTKAGMVTGESIPLMLEMALNPASRLGSAATQKMVQYGTKRAALQFVEEGVKRFGEKEGLKWARRQGEKWVSNHARSMLAAKIATRGIGDIAGATAMSSTTGLARVATDYERRLTGNVDIGVADDGTIVYNGFKDQESPAAALFKSLASNSIENWSEMAGNYFGFINSYFGRVLGKSVIGKAGRKALQTTGSVEGIGLNKAQKFIYELSAGKGIGAFSKGLDQFLKRTQWNGIGNEYLEEVLGNIVNASLVGDMTFDAKKDTGVFNLEQNIDTFCGVALMGGFMSALNTAGYAAHKINYNVDRVSNANSKLFGDELWGDVKTMIDNSYKDPRELNDALTYLLRGETGSKYSEEEKKAILKYTQAVLEKDGAEMVNYQPRMADSSREEVTTDGKKEWVVTSRDVNGNPINQQSFNTEDEAIAYEGELKMEQQQRDFKDFLNMTNKLSFSESNAVIDEFMSDLGISEESEKYAETIAEINDPKSELGKQFNTFKYSKIIEKAKASQSAIATFEEENGWEPGTVKWLSEQDPMQLDGEALAMADQARDFLEKLAYPDGEIHIEHDQQVGRETAQAVVEQVISDEEPIDPMDNAGSQLTEQLLAAKQKRDAAFENNEDLKEEVERLEARGLSPQEVVSSLTTFNPEEVQSVIDYYNAQAKYDGFMDEAAKQIDNVAHRERERRTFKGTINGTPNDTGVVEVTDGENTYTLVSGNISTDDNGRVLSSDSGLLIGVDGNGDFVSLGDRNGLVVTDTQMTLDQWEEGRREELQQQVSMTIDPNQQMVQEEAEVTEENPQEEVQEGAVGVEAGGTKITGADEASTTTPTEEGAAIPENEPSKIESVVDKDGVKRYEQGIDIDTAIEDIKNDGFDVNETADLAINEAQDELNKIKTPKTRAEQVRNATKRKALEQTIEYYTQLKKRNAELESLNNPIESNNEPKKTITLQDKQRKLQSGAEEKAAKRIKALKEQYGNYFDDDFSVAQTVEELAAMHIGRNRTLSREDLARELGHSLGLSTGEPWAETLLAKKGEGRTVNQVAHDAWESAENPIIDPVNNVRRFDVDEIRNAIIDLFNSSEKKSDITEYAINRREEAARKQIEDEKRLEEELSQSKQEVTLTAEEIAEMEKNLPFAMSTDEEIPDAPIVQLIKAVEELRQQEGMPEIKLVDTDRMNDDEWYDIASAMYDGVFVTQDEIDFVRGSVLRDGLYIIDDSGAITIYSDSQTADDVKYKVEYINNQSNGRSNEEETGGLETQDVQRPEEGVSAVQGTEAQAESESEGSTESGGVEEEAAETQQPTQQDEYLKPRNEEERKAVADVEAKLQEDIAAAKEEVRKAKSALEKAQVKESDKATDLFGNDNTFNQEGQLFDNSEMPVDQSVEGVNKRTKAEADALGAAQQELDRLQSEAEHNSRVRGALDELRRQTSLDTAELSPREQYLSEHPLTVEQIMADTEATEDEKQDAIDFLNGDDERAISQFTYDLIYNRVNGNEEKPSETQQENPLEAIQNAAEQFRNEQKAKDQEDIDSALKEFNDFLDNAKGSNILDKFMRKGIEGNDKAQSNLLDALTGTNEAQRMFLKDLLRLASKVGYAYIKSGIHDVQAWNQQMFKSIGKKLSDVLNWEDTLINDFIDEVWEQKYTVDGERMRLREHAEKLKNNKGADTAVNVNKKENNVSEKELSLQQEKESEAKPQPVELQGDSAEFAERQQKIDNLSKEIAKTLRRSASLNGTRLTLQYYKSLAKTEGLDDISDTDLQELIESEVVNLARDIANGTEETEEQKYQHIVRLYENQPTLSARDNDRINMQQYSTPAPMAFLMGRFVKDGKDVQRGLEPSAGNGMLTVNLPKEKMHVNDIDEMRLSNLEKQGYGEVTSQDGTLSFGDKNYDVVVTNPPFGSVTPKVYDGIYEISALEHQMAINALESMKDDGRAAIIIGGNTEYNQNGSIKGRDRIFLNYLYAHYNVVDVINMNGHALYSKQGTGYPVRMILIDGRKEFNPNTFAPVIQKARAERVNNYEDLYKRVSDDILRNKEHNRDSSSSVHTAESGENGRLSDNGNVSSSNEKGVRSVRPGRRDGEHQLPTESVNNVRRSDTSTEAREGQGDTKSEGDGGLGTRPVSVHGRGDQSEQSGGSETVPSGNGRGEVADGGSNSERLPGESVDSRGRLAVEQPQEQRALGTEKVPYRQQSTNPFSLQSQMPAEQADVVKKALEGLGDVDQFLVDELGYSSKEELHQALAAEQIDSVALAIHQMKNGDAFIIGDQTGIGKGRQGAALIRWAVKNGTPPVYFTAKPELFSSVYRDLKDIHSGELRPFILASDKQKARIVEEKDGVQKVLFDLPTDKEQKRVIEYINKNGKLPPEYDFMITTYSQVGNGTMEYDNGVKKARSYGKNRQATTADYNGQAKRDAIERLSGNSVAIMDESHLAGGESARGNFLQYISTKAKGITYISATFAKRPDNMPLYSLRTAISKAGVKVGELIDAVKRGGATFQEIMSKALTEAGQMIRRERDMTGVNVDWKGIEDEDVIKKHYKQYDTVIGLFNDIINFQRTYVDPIVNGMNDEAAEVQGEVNHTPGTRDMGINNTPFASRTFQIVKQVLLSLKAEEGAKFAIECLKKGEKPVICLENTNEGAADKAVGGSDEDMTMPDLSVNLKEGLRGTLRISKKDAFGNTQNEMIPFESLSEAGQNRYREIMDAIDKASTGLSLSPIDVIKNEIRKAGYTIAELTGRKKEFVFNEDGTVKRVNRTDTDNKKNAADFNNGRIDAVLINKSAGTGIDLHAGIKFKNTDQRHMIVVQAQSDINDEVQMRGRTDRTGQKQHSRYTYIVSTIPSEQRLLMMLKAKLRSLDANTTSSQKSKFNEMQVQDIINKYGDDIVIQYLAENPDLAEKMCDPLKWGKSLGDDYATMPAETLIPKAEKAGEAGDTAKSVLGKMALLTVREQEKMLAEVGELYQAEIDRLNEMGENDLEITEMPLKAKTLKSAVWEEGVEPGGKNPFADNSYVEEVEMDVLKKPMKAEEIKKSQARLLGNRTWDEYKQEQLESVEKWANEKKEETTKTITERAEKKAAVEKAKYAKAAKKAQENNGLTDEEIERNSEHQYNTIYKQEMEKLTNALDAIDRQKQAFVDAFELFSTDGVYALPTDIYDLSQITFEPSFGKVIDIKISPNYSTAASTISFATLDGRRKITIPINGMVKQQNNDKRNIIPSIMSQTAQARNGFFGTNVRNTLKVLEQSVDNWDRLTSTATRKKGYIITGNLLKALTSLRNQGKSGKLISYTTDTGEIRQGILMSDNFDPAGLTSKNPISTAKDQLNWSGDKIVSADKEVVVKKDGWGPWYQLKVPKSKKRGEKYFNDKVLLSLIEGQFTGSTTLTGDFKADNLDAVLKRLDELGVTVESAREESTDTGRRFDEDIEEGSQIDTIKDNVLSEFVLSSKTNAPGRRIPIGSLTEDGRAYLEKLSGLTLKPNTIFVLNASDLRHIYNEHYGDNEKDKGNNIPLTDEDIRSMVDVISNPDRVVFAISKGRVRKIFYMFKENPNGTYNLAEVYSNSNGSLTAKSYFKTKRDVSQRVDDLKKSPTLTSVTDGALPSLDAKIPKLFEVSKKFGNFNTEEARFDEGVAEAQQQTEHKRRIAEHIDKLVEKLGTKAKTTVYHSLDEVPEEVRKLIEARHKQGRKVRGWYENGQVYLYLPDIDSIYQAEKTIWHETVAHHGLRELVGKDNYDKLLKRLWLEHQNGEMGEWVTKRMTMNGWSLGVAIDEYLAREAEKNPFKEPTLWQRLKWILSDILHDLGFKTEPTITDVQYLFWASQNQLREGDVLGELKRNAFLDKLEKAAAEQTEPYVNLKAERVEDIERRFDEDIDEPLERESAKDLYNERLDTAAYITTEAYQDGMLSLKVLQNAIVKDGDIPASQDAYMAENLSHGKSKNEQDLYNVEYRDPLVKTVNSILRKMGWSMKEMNQYLLSKSGLERNRELYVRDWLAKERKKSIDSYDKLNTDEKARYDKKAADIEELFDDGTIATEEERDAALQKALKEAHDEYVNDIEEGWERLKEKGNTIDERYTFADYMDELAKYIQEKINKKYEPSKHDYSGLTEMYGENYDEGEIIEDVMSDETAMEEADTLWQQINAANEYALERYRQAGMRSDEEIDKVKRMFHWYVPMRGFDKTMGEDMYQYFTSKQKANSYVGGLLKQAKGRKSRAKAPLATMFAMAYKAIGDCNQNLVNQKLYRLCEAHPNDLVILSDAWAVLDEKTGMWKEAYPDIPEDASDEEVRQITLDFEKEMKQEALDGKAMKIKGKAKIDYAPMDKRKRDEHVVDVRINGNLKRMTIVGNPRAAQALNGHTRFERTHNLISNLNARIKNWMSTAFTSLSPTFAMRNLMRDWTHFRMMLGVREGQGYAHQAAKYYKQTFPRPYHGKGKTGMVELFKKYRAGTLDMNKEVERDFKDFMDNGGVTGFVQMRKIEDIERQMDKLNKQLAKGKAIRLNNKLWDWTLGALEAYNEAIENNARFATYRASRHYAGRTKARSAYDAKEITVNFNRKGSGSKAFGFKSENNRVRMAAQAAGLTSQVIGEGRLFFNATIQAIATTFKNFKNPDGSWNKKYIAAWTAKYAFPPFAFGLALPFINQALSAMFGSDDDDPYANLPDWVRRKNLCFYIGNDNFITIPVGQELAAFLALGDIAAGMSYYPNIKPVDKSLDEEALEVLNTFSPVDIDTKVTKDGLWSKDWMSELAGKTFSVLTPVISIENNLSWTGRAIYKDSFGFSNNNKKPEYQMVFSGTNPVLVEASKLLHEISGGDDLKRGKIEINPAVVQYLWEQYSGGPGKFLSNTSSIGKDVKDMFSGKEPDFNIRKVEGLKAFVQQGDDRTQYYRTQAKYRKYAEDAERLRKLERGYEKLSEEDPMYKIKLEELQKGVDYVRMQILYGDDSTDGTKKELEELKDRAAMAEGKESKGLWRAYNEQMKEVVDLLDEAGADDRQK